MKILAIRGRNLASLAGEFEVVFDAPPLDTAGVFAITGPTGAGKSSLLDALCLALFDQTPRLASRGGVLVGRADEDDKTKLASGDVRNLLRRGAAEAYAEVVFIGRDGRRYRARWSVHRARGRAAGRVQHQAMELEELDSGRQLGGTKSETLEAIRDRLGLSFDQFRRSALLAQGEFAAFLRAPERDRADLLERMTGTEIYGRLSRAAFDRAKAEREQLAALGQRRADASALDAEARARLDADLAAATTRAAAATARAELAARVAEADARRRAAAGAVEALIGEHAAAATAAERADAERRSADARHRAAVGALEAARPALERAATLDAERAQAAREAERATAERTRAGDAEAAARRDLEAACAAVRDAELGVREAETWLDEHAAAAPLVAQWERWQRELTRAATAAARAEQLDAERAAAGDAIAVAERAFAGAEAERRAAQAALDRAREPLAAAEAALAAAETARASVDREALDDRLARLEELRVAVDEARQLQDQLDAATAAADAAERHARRDRDRAAQLAAKLEVARAQSAEAELAATAARAAQGLSSHRAALIDGDPCPLCGAEEHPWADRAASAVDALVVGAEARTAKLRGVVNELALTERDALNRADEHAHRAAESRARAAELRAALARAASAWREQVAAVPGVPDDVATDEVETALARLFETARRDRDRAARADRRAEQCRRELDTARAALERARERWIAAKDAAAACDRGRADAAAALRRCEDRRADALAIRAAAEAELAPALAARASWRASFARDPRRLAEELAGEVGAYRARAEARDQGLAALARGRAQVDAARARATERAEADARAAAVAAERHAELAALSERRAALLDGRATAEVRDELERAVTAAARAREAEQARWERASAQAVSLAARLDTRKAELEAREAELAAASAEAGDAQPGDVAETRAEAASAEATRLELSFAVRRDDEARASAAELDAAIAAQQAVVDRWSAMAELIGSADGKKFRVFAQSLTLDALIEHANHHLDELAPRYRLQRVPGYDLELQVVDRDMGDEVRSVDSLSGGESFLVSLALALALSSLSSRDTQVESLLIDEGFGTLDEATMDVALATLEALQASGRKVGLISHVAGLAERIGVHVRVEPRGGGRSEVSVVAS